MNVDQTTMTQPTAKTAQLATDNGAPTFQITAGTGCHQPNSAHSASLAASPTVLRTAAAGTRRVRRQLNPSLAITVCCTAKASRSPTSIAIDGRAGLLAVPSTEVGALQSAKKPNAQALLSRKAP